MLATHRASSQTGEDSAWPSRYGKKEVSPMEQTNEEIKAHLMATDGHFRSLIEEHALFHKQLEQLEAKDQLTLADEEVEHRLKKHKLRLKDEINMILSRTQQMA
ncbi:MAG: YdcH family protein [Acidobacteriota bacterium]